jgi:hypothetical protein
MVGDDKISFQDLCLLRHNAVLPGKQLLLFQRQQASPKYHKLFNDRNGNTSYNTYIFVNSNVRTSNLEMSLVCELPWNHNYYYRNKQWNSEYKKVFSLLYVVWSDLNEVYMVLRVCHSNNTNGALGKLQSYQVSYMHISSRNSNNNNNNKTKNNKMGNMGKIRQQTLVPSCTKISCNKSRR